MDNDSIREFIDDYPGYLRVNKETLALKIDYIVISEILLMAYRSNLLDYDIDKNYENNMNDLKISILDKLFKSMARRILEKSGLAFTCSMERLQSRLLFISKKDIYRNNNNDDNNNNNEDNNIQHSYANLLSNSITLKEGIPIWHKKKTSTFYEIENHHIDGITFLSSILTYENILFLKEEWEQILSKSLMSLLPAPPLHSFLYSETKFNKWLASRQYYK